MLGLAAPKRFTDTLPKMGFNDGLDVGKVVLPSGLFGPISVFNSEGKYIKHSDQPMETAYRTVEWHWKEWHGRYEQVERSKFVDVPYKRYPRTFVPPPSIELKLAATTNGELILVGPLVQNSPQNMGAITHIVNLFLEIFGECQFFTEDLDEIINIPTKRLNWKILPPGQRPWAQLKKDIAPIIKHAPEGSQAVMIHRLSTVHSHKPDFAAVGKAGFSGYIIFGFSKKGIYALESMFYGNATYIFGHDWEALSKMTKAEILDQNLQKDRIIHREGWEKHIKSLLL
jgi:hypothetical protein